MYPLLRPQEDDQFVYDAEAGDALIRFCHKFITHFSGELAGEPFILAPVQQQIIRDIRGWKERKTGSLRFVDVWWEAAIGSGKSPILALLGIYELVAGGEPGAEIYSIAANFSQARIVFDTAKRFIEQSPELSARLEVTQYEIRSRLDPSFWRITSGKGPKAGAKPQLVLADEIHEWEKREIYDSFRSRMSKRRSPQFICATNAGTSRQSLCWQLHEEAVAVLEGKSGNKRLYPIIWCADSTADISSPATWREANPLIDITVSEDKVQQEYERRKGSPALEADFQRLYCGQWVKGSQKWLDMKLWDACTAQFDHAEMTKHPLWVSLDFGEADDLTSLTKIWSAPDRFYVDSHFWLPAAKAQEYQQSNGITYLLWAEEKPAPITLVDDPTINIEVQYRIADEIIALSKLYKLKAVTYDRRFATHCVNRIEAAGVTAVMPIGQGYTITPGCSELYGRLKEKAITIMPNPVMRMCAENVTLKFDDRGNYWPVKPGGKGGGRPDKIDGIQALVTGLTEARKHTFANTKQWKGTVSFMSFD